MPKSIKGYKTDVRGKILSVKRKVAVYIIVALIVLTIAYIWLNSVKTQAESAESSEPVYETIQKVADDVFGEGTVEITHDWVRKFAHFFEFAALGAEFCVLYILLKRQSLGGFIEMLPFGLYVSVIDEGIQMLSDRGPEVRDIFIDYGGYLAATLAFFIVFLIRRAIKNGKEKQA